MRQGQQSARVVPEAKREHEDDACCSRSLGMVLVSRCTVRYQWHTFPESMQLLSAAACVAIAAVAAYGDAGAGVQRSGAGLQASCNVTADAPDMARWGDDVLSSPLSLGSTLAACQALCCASTTCVAYSFNSPQPNDTCVGGSCCTVGDVCCMLKGSPGGTLRKNPYPGVVQTGTVGHAAGPGPSPPFPPSTTITGLTW